MDRKALGLPSNDFTHLWNDLPQEMRHHLMPYQIESHILHLWQAKQVAIKAHKAHMRHMDQSIKNLEQSLKEYRIRGLNGQMKG